MSIVNVEIKAVTDNGDKIRQILNEKGARFVGIDRQTDTYFNVVNGRLKLREGNIEAIDKSGDIGREKLLEQCNYYLTLFGIEEKDLVPVSYSDLILDKKINRL